MFQTGEVLEGFGLAVRVTSEGATGSLAGLIDATRMTAEVIRGALRALTMRPPTYKLASAKPMAMVAAKPLWSCFLSFAAESAGVGAISGCGDGGP